MPADIFAEFRRALEAKQQENQEEKGSMIEVKVDGKIILIKKPIIAPKRNKNANKIHWTKQKARILFSKNEEGFIENDKETNFITRILEAIYCKLRSWE